MNLCNGLSQFLCYRSGSGHTNTTSWAEACCACNCLLAYVHMHKGFLIWVCGLIEAH